MSVTVSTPQEICHNPLNTSQAKMLYSFAKANKFGVDSKSPCSQAFYDLPPVKTSRAPGFGYGTKYDFTKNAVQNPAPNNYKLPDPLENAKKKIGYSFGLSREAMSITGGFFVGDKNSPGPGAYDTRESNKVAIAYSFKSRTAGGEGSNTSRVAPGPGNYPTYETITPKGQYFVSKYKNSGANTFAPPRSARFPDIKDGRAPGPGTYDIDAAISPKGVYPNSKFRASLVRSFGHSARSTVSEFNLKAAPGPGTYKLPSDFGHYESKHAKEFEEKMASTLSKSTFVNTIKTDRADRTEKPAEEN